MELQFILLRLLALLPALVLHEFAHGYSAYRMGDPTPKMDGRLTLNPLAHLDPIGTLMIIFAPIGWAKPVRINPYNFHDPAKGMFLSTACGPLSNLIQGTFWALVLRAIVVFGGVAAIRGNVFAAFLAMAVITNFALAIFNLIPLGPLDGHEVLPYFLPYEQKVRYHAFNRQYGAAVLFGLIIASFMFNLRILEYVILVPAVWLGRLISGSDPYGVLAAALQLI